MAKRISGQALNPQVSLNGVFYWPQEMEKFDGLTVPLKFNHTDRIIGEATFHLDREKNIVNYEATVKDPEFQRAIDIMNFQVSIGASIKKGFENEKICHPEGKGCFKSAIIGVPEELSIVETPGIPNTSVNVLESKVYEVYNTSNSPETKDLNIMAEQIKDEKVEERVKVTIETDDKIEVAQPKEETKPEESKKEEPKKTKEDCNCGQSHPDHEEAPKAETPKVDANAIKAAVDAEVAKQTSEILKDVRERFQPTSEVKESKVENSFYERPYTDEEAEKIVEQLRDKGYYNMEIDKESWINAHTFVRSEDGKVTEAISTSGTIPTVVADTQIVITPGARTFKPIRQFGKFKAIPKGSNTARFYRIDIPGAGALTESPTTDFTATTHTLTAVDVTCAVRGWRQVVEWSEFEDYPATLLNTIRETARLSALSDEHNLILQDLGATDHDFGGTTTAPYHIGSDGVATTDPTEEDADPELDFNAFTHVKRFLEAQGHDTSPGQVVAFISPRAHENLIADSNLSEYSMIGNANITKLGAIERLFGIDVIVTNGLETGQNNADRNIFAVKGKAWALASQRTMNVKIQERIAGGYVDIVWSHRIGVDVVDASAYMIVSSPNA